MGWNKEYLLEVYNVLPINYISIDRITTLNTILDKINVAGLSSLNSDELSFLGTYSKS